MIIAKSITGERTQVDAKDLVWAINLYAVVVKEGKILISPQWKENGFDFPGGHLELGEKHLDGLVREVKEETGFNVKPTKIIDVFTSFFMHPRKNRPQQSIKIYYGADIVSGEISTEGFDEGELSYARPACFVTLQELKNMEFMCVDQGPLEFIMPYLEQAVKKVV